MNPKETHTYKQLVDATEEMKEANELYKEIVESSLDEYGLSTVKCREFANTVTHNDIAKQPDNMLDDIINALGNFNDEKLKKTCKEHYITHMLSEKKPDEIRNSEETFDERFSEIKTIIERDLINFVISVEEEIKENDKTLEKIKEESDNAIDDWVKYLSSDEYISKKQKNLDNMKEKCNTISDPIEKKKALEKINAIENSITLKFIFNRIDKYGENEIVNIKNAFFDDKKSGYILKKFIARSKEFGFNDNIYQIMFNIEEKFMDEKYSVYNNLFTFFILRFVAYADPNSSTDSLYVKSLIQSTANLIYQRFSSEKKRQEFIDLIESILDKFSKYHDEFDKNNILHPNHPKRIARKQEEESSVKEMVYKNLELAGYDVTDAVKALDKTALKKLYDEVLDDQDKKNQPKSNLNDLIDKIHLNTDDYEKTKLKKEYMQYAEWNDTIMEKFNNMTVDEAREFVENEKKSFEEKQANSKDDENDTEPNQG